VSDNRGKALADLRRVDERTLRFTPNGLGISVKMRPEDSAHFQAAAIAQAVAAEDVPDDVRNNLERARKLHRYGVLEYEFFTAASDYALLVLEGALRARFVSYYDGAIPVLHKGHEETLAAQTFDDVRDAARTAKLRLSDGTVQQVPISTGALLDWARRERLLSGTRTRVTDRALAALRNHAAHPVTHTINMPPDSARMIRDVTEVINRLWGHDTPGGHLFPAPLEREPRVAALAPGGKGAGTMRLDQVASAPEEWRTWQYVVCLAVEADDLTRIGADGLEFAHRPGFQTTAFPCEELWRGTWPELVEAIDVGTFEDRADTVMHLDRVFYIRTSGDELDLACSSENVLALPRIPDGRWLVVRADSPWDAWLHVRDHGDAGTEQDGACSACFVKVEGEFDSAPDVLAYAQATNTA
jgi:hypothetical protein